MQPVYAFSIQEVDNNNRVVVLLDYTGLLLQFLAVCYCNVAPLFVIDI